MMSAAVLKNRKNVKIGKNAEKMSAAVLKNRKKCKNRQKCGKNDGVNLWLSKGLKVIGDLGGGYGEGTETVCK
jgi:hypothetical protein